MWASPRNPCLRMEIGQGFLNITKMTHNWKTHIVATILVLFLIACIPQPTTNQPTTNTPSGSCGVSPQVVNEQPFCKLDYRGACQEEKAL